MKARLETLGYGADHKTSTCFHHYFFAYSRLIFSLSCHDLVHEVWSVNDMPKWVLLLHIPVQNHSDGESAVSVSLLFNPNPHLLGCWSSSESLRDKVTSRMILMVRVQSPSPSLFPLIQPSWGVRLHQNLSEIN